MLEVISNLIPDPLHPAVVHLPIALSVLVPAFAIGSLIAISRGARPLRAWGLTTLLLATLSASAWAAQETGENEEERVENVVPEDEIHTHEEAAGNFLTISLLTLLIAGFGLSSGKVGMAARLIAAGGTLALLASAYSVGHSGGTLVYGYGAASAYSVDDSTRATNERLRRQDDDR